MAEKLELLRLDVRNAYIDIADTKAKLEELEMVALEAVAALFRARDRLHQKRIDEEGKR